MRAKVISFAVLGAAACADLQESTTEHVATVASELSVDQAANSGCSTKSVEGLTKQIIAQADCLTPGSFVEVPKRPNMTYGSAVVPFMEQPARDALLKAVDANKNTSLTINSMLRSVAQQYLLYRWYVNGQCSIGLAAKPGTSNHETGLAIDVQNYTTWKPLLTNAGFTWLGANDPVHFDYSGPGAVSQAKIGVQAFQELWNKNHPNDLIAEDGLYGPQTEARLKQAPAEGFAVGPDPSCGMSGSGGSGAGGSGAGGSGSGAGGDNSLNIPATIEASFADAKDTYSDGPSKGVPDLLQGRSYELVITVTNTGDTDVASLEVAVALPPSLSSGGSDAANVTIGPVAAGKQGTGKLKLDAVAYSVLDVAPQEIGLSTATANATAKVDVYSERRWEFDGERLEGWTSSQKLGVTSNGDAQAEVFDGELVGAGAAGDLALTSPPIAVTTAGLGSVTLLARRSGDSGGKAQLYFNDAAIALDLPADGDLHEITIAESELPPKVTSIRFVPFEGGTAKSASASLAHVRLGEELAIPADDAAGCTCSTSSKGGGLGLLAMAAFGGTALSLARRRRR